MAETSAQDARSTERLHAYWVHGEGAAKIRWGEPGDFGRCVDHLGKFIADAAGYCNLAHKAATGIYPATHAAEIRKETGRSQVTTATRAVISTADQNNAPDSDFAYIESGGTKDGSGKTVPRSLRHFYIGDADHVRNALSRAPQSPFGDKAMPKIREAARKFKIDVADDSGSASRGELMRDYPLEDLHIVRSAEGGDGRTVEAFAAVFNTETEIMDHQGHYLEVISPTAFNKRLSDLRRSKAGFGGVKVIFNHGRSPDGTPVERFMMPVAKPVTIEATDRGLLTRSRYFDTPLGNEVLQLISEGGITSQSFVGKIVRSDPELGRHGRYRPDSSGRLTTVHRTELGLREYGGVLFAAYEGAEILGVRMATPGTWEPAEFDAGTSPDGEAAAGEPFTPDEGAEHSARYHQHALYVLRSQEQREKAGLVW